MHQWDGTRMHLWSGTGIHYRMALEKAFEGGFIPWKSQLAAPLWHPPASSCPWHSPAGTRGRILVTYGYPPGSSLSPGHFPKFLRLSLDDPCGSLPMSYGNASNTHLDHGTSCSRETRDRRTIRDPRWICTCNSRGVALHAQVAIHASRRHLGRQLPGARTESR